MKKIVIKARIYSIILVTTLLTLSACSSGGGSGGSDDDDGSTQTGYLVDSAVSGVSYNTATQSGVTGSDGAFLYETGETVTFSLGNTTLGSSVGKDQLSLFDLVPGATPLIGREAIDAELSGEKNPFQSVINLAVLLQTLDEDGDSDNGIKISAAVAALFTGVSINFEQGVNKFKHDSGFRSVLNQANAQTRLFDKRVIKNPAYAIDHLYKTLGIDPQLYAVTHDEEDDNADGFANYIITYQYDSNGNQTRYESDDNGDGTVNTITTYQYDRNGNLTRWERDSNGDGSANRIETYQYSNGNQTRHEVDDNGDGSANYIYTTQYDANGNRTRWEKDSDGDGTVDKIWTTTYASVGWLILKYL